ncbi:flavodoxin domain-containing protein [Mesobacillus maritimus]|uniref:flavodoxin domain-containing protein n=1 Tax=Mesobacillus maritimus TaxID=1643336 RepID=UPI00384ECC1A
MKVLIVYCSSHGTTTKAALLLKKQIKGDVIVLNLNKAKLHSDVDLFDAVIIGGSIHTGSIQGRVKKFVKENLSVLRTKRIGLFLCCMREGQIALEQFENAFPIELRKQATATGIFGGEFLVSQMNFFEKQLVKRVGGVTTDTSRIDEEAIGEFADVFNTKQNVTLCTTQSPYLVTEEMRL